MSLRTRLVLAVLAVAVVALVAADLVTYSAMRSFLYSRNDQSLQQAVGSLLPSVQGPPAGGPAPVATTTSAAATSVDRADRATRTTALTLDAAVAAPAPSSSLPAGPPPGRTSPPSGPGTGSGPRPPGAPGSGTVPGSVPVTAPPPSSTLPSTVPTTVPATAPTTRPAGGDGGGTGSGTTTGSGDPGTGSDPGTGDGSGATTGSLPGGTQPTPPSDLQPPFATHARRLPGMSVEVRGADGTVVAGPYLAYQNGVDGYAPKLPAVVSGFSEPTATQPAEAFFFAPSTKAGGPEFRVLAAKTATGDVLFVGTPLTDTDSTLQRLLVIVLIVTGIALVAALLLGWWLVWLGLRPLADVEDTAGRIAGGQLGQRVPGENDRTEVGRLARALNIMLARIERAFAERNATEAELRQSEAELRQSEERLRQFVGDASHELRTPLAAVSAYAELFDRGASEHPDDLARVMAGIQGESTRMKGLVEDLLLLARLDEGRPLERAPVDLVALADGAVQAANAVGPAWPVRLEAARPVEIVGDEDRIRQVLDNLLANVRAHTPEGTPVTVRVGVEPDQHAGVVLQVADRGPGLGPGDAEKVFERFYRTDRSRARANGGSGLGLSIVASVVAAHGGRVEAANRPDGGTVITVHLPWYPPVPPAVERRPAPPAALGGGSGRP